MNFVYLGACLARFKRFDCNIFYNDIDPIFKPDLLCDMLDVDLSLFDAILASPPCNFYSRANYRRYSSNYSLVTKDLLPKIIHKCFWSNKPFIVENVRNNNLLKPIIDMCLCLGIHVYLKGRHTYFTNIDLKLYDIPQVFDDIQHKYHYSMDSSKYRQGGINVELVFNRFIDTVLYNEV